MAKQGTPTAVPRLRFPGNEGKIKLKNGYAFKSSTYAAGNFRIVTIANVQSGLLRVDGAKSIAALPQDIQAHQRLELGDILISMTGNVGRVCLVDSPGLLLNQRVGKLVAYAVNLNFFYQTLQREEFRESMQLKAAGGAQGNLSASDITGFAISNPPDEREQQKIADCLTSLDEVIAAQGQKVAALKAHKRGLMRQLFPREGETRPRLRFPEFRNAPEWEVKPFSELFTIGNGRDYKHLGRGDIPVYGSGGYMLSVDDHLHDGESVCIGRKGTINKPMFLSGKFWTVDTLFYTHSFKRCLPRFIFLNFKNIDWLKHNEAGGVPSLSKSNIERIRVAIPAVDEQQRIADCLSTLYSQIAAEINQLAALKIHKQGLMQQLFPAPQAAGA